MKSKYKPRKMPIDLGSDLLPRDPKRAMEVIQEFNQKGLEDLIRKLGNLSLQPHMNEEDYLDWIIEICEDIYVEDPETTNEEFVDKFIHDYKIFKNLL